MSDRETADNLKPLKEAITNATKGSIVKVEAERDPMLFFRPQTGELIAVPSADVNALNTEIGRWNSLIATLHDANEQVQYYEDVLSKLAFKPDLRTPGARDTAEKNVAAAVERQEKALDDVQEEIKSLSKIGSAGKELVELIPLRGESRKKSESKPGELEDGSYKKSWGQHSIADGVKRNFSTERIRRPQGSFVYVPSDKVKKKWPTFKDPAEMKWSDALKRRADGSIAAIDPDKAREYSRHLKKNLTIQSDFFHTFEAESEGVLWDWANAWNKQHKFNKEYSPSVGSVPMSIELDAGAQLMRYLAGASLHATFQPFKKNVAIRAEGHAEIALAEAKGSASLYFPAKDGWMWTLPASYRRDPTNTKEIDLGAVRLMAAIECKGAVGASIALEVSLGVETKEGQMPRVVGRRTPQRGKRRAARNQVVTLGPEETMTVAGVDAGIDAFAGLKAEGEIKGAVEWRNPENEKKEFEAFASLAPAIGGLAGLGGSAKLTVQYTKGIFRLHADASLCLGFGAEGKLSFEVSIKLLFSFLKWFACQLYNADYKTLDFIEASAFKTVKNLLLLEIANAKKVLFSYYGESEDGLEKAVANLMAQLDKPEARQRLARTILSAPELLRYAPPETKSILIYHLINIDDIEAGVAHRGNEGDTQEQQLAISHLLGRWSQTQSELSNVIQHISADGSKGDFSTNLAMLHSFFGESMPPGALLANIGNRHPRDFDQWYDCLFASLKKEPTRGFPLVPSDSIEYAMQRDNNEDHPLFSSSGDGAFYA